MEVPARLELATFCVLSRRDNHYTMEPLDWYVKNILHKANFIIFFEKFHNYGIILHSAKLWFFLYILC